MFFQIDDELAMFNEQKNDKKRNIILVATVFLIMTGMLILDSISRWRNATLSQLQCNAKTVPEFYFTRKLINRVILLKFWISDLAYSAKEQIESSLAFYMLYYILMALQTQLAQTALGIQRRYLRLNSAITDIFSLGNTPFG